MASENPDWLRELLSSPYGKAAVEEAVRQRLADADIKRYIEFSAQSQAEGAISAQIAWRIRVLKWIYSGLGVLGVSMVALLYFFYSFFVGQTEKVQKALEPIGRIPAVVLKTGATFQKLHKDRSDLAQR